MRLRSLKYKSYKIQLALPFINSQDTFKFRTGIILKAQDVSGEYYFAEISPLPGYNTDNLDECIVILDRLKNNSDFFDLIELLTNNEIRNLPSLKFAFEQIRFAYLLKTNKFRALYPDISFQNIIEINGLVDLLPVEEAIIQTKKLIDKGFSTIKIKIGRKFFQDDYEVLREASNSNSGKIKIRADVNGKWSAEESMMNLQKLEGMEFEYIEEPTKNLNNLIDISGRTSIPIAIDESIKTLIDVRKTIDSKNINHIIIKPTVNFGIEKTIELIKLAELHNKKIIISSALENMITNSYLIFLASLTGHKSAHGLSNISGRNDWFYEPDGNKLKFDIDKFPPDFDLYWNSL